MTFILCNFRRLAMAAALSALPLVVHALPVDKGPVAGTNIQKASVTLKLRNQQQLVDYVKSTSNPKSANFHKFLTVNQFKNIYSPLPSAVTNVINDLKAHGLTVSRVSANNLVVQTTGKVSDLNKYFATSLHRFVDGQVSYIAPVRTPSAPAHIAPTVSGINGLSTKRLGPSKFVQRPAFLGTNRISGPKLKPHSTASGVPGLFTVGDVVQLYQVQPLYDQGFLGQGKTIGIVTLATFDPNDAYAYWNGIGLSVPANRITLIDIDGGGDTGGSIETALDVEQSGGLAPQANIVVYDGLPYDDSFLNALNQAVVDNLVDTISTSWGAPETLTSPDFVAAFDEILLEAAAQGISVFATSGDAGAYDLNRELTPPYYSPVLSVDYPGTSPFLTCAGGLTIANTQQFGSFTVTVTNDRPWGWNYLQGVISNLGFDYYDGANGFFPVGAGGGVSFLEALPDYQTGIPCIKSTQPSQFVRTAVDQNSGGIIYLDPLFIFGLPQFPDNFPGRNVPDISLNADPNTGYLVELSGYWYAGGGGTSFVAPQLNGIAALLSQSMGSRLGLLNPALYRIAQKTGYPVNGPFNDIISGDNLGYQAGPGYDQGSGIGSINAAALAAALAADAGP